jgi:chorismate mutase / prephenate dehydratase
MNTMRVAHFGDEDAYAAEAAARLYPQAELQPCRSTADVMRAVTRGEAGSGVLPIENSLAGAIPETYDLLAHAPLAIVDETVLAVPHCLVGLAGTNIDALVRIHSHPAALAQCRRFLSSLPDTLPDVAPSTAAAARRVAEGGDPSHAAISSRRAGERMGLSVLLNDVSDHAQNYTRFVAVAPHTRLDRQNGAEWRTAVRFVTHHHPGALAAAIQPLAEFAVNMTSLQSRPIPGRPWNYQFYADLEGHPLDGRMADALRALESAVAELSYLGCYPACERP